METYKEWKGRPEKMEVRGARVHNLKRVDVDIPLHEIVGICGVSGSGKSSLALGVLYAEGSRRYLESLSTYTRRRLTQAAEADVDDVRYVPAALALHQRPGVPGIRSTFGTGSELLNSLRLLFSRVGSYLCPNGHRVPPSTAVAAEKDLICPVCHAAFRGLGAEELSFNSTGACPECDGTGTVRRVDESTLVPDDSLSIDEGAVLPWQTLMWSLMKDIARDKLHIRTDIPFRDLSEREKELVFHGPPEKHHLVYHNETTNAVGEMDFTYFNAVYTVENALSHVKDEKGMKRVEKFLSVGPCPACGGSRLSEQARVPQIRGLNLADVCRMPLGDLVRWVDGVPGTLPGEVQNMARSIADSFLHTAARLMDLGLSYLSLDREASTLSTGERQRMQLARAVRNRTTGVMYVLDEPSIGLHPVNLKGVISVMDDLVRDGNSVILVDHDVQMLRHADELIEMGPGAGKNGGRVVAQGTVARLEENPDSRIGGYLCGKKRVENRPVLSPDELFRNGAIELETGPLHTVKPLSVRFPVGRLNAVSGVSGSGKTTLILESLVAAFDARAKGEKIPSHVLRLDAPQIERVRLIDATPIGINVRSTVATYADVHDELRRIYARLDEAKKKGYRAGDFSYNTGSLRCPVCDGVGTISLDVQFLPDVEIPCPECKGSRYSKDAQTVRLKRKGDEGPGLSMPELMRCSVDEAMEHCRDLPQVYRKLEVLSSLGLGYLTLGEATPNLSGGEAQRLKLASEMGHGQAGSVFVFDEPTIGLHPDDVSSLLGVFRSLIDRGATLIVIEHDPDILLNADYCVDMGPGGGEEGGRVVVCGTPEQLMDEESSLTGRCLKEFCAGRNNRD
ncbi:MAG: excinuclease ABC subunit UvrA [Clostridia bacterium]|nr:excinuclease ABC subunit UvrA [Clostridia bacterium]